MTPVAAAKAAAVEAFLMKSRRVCPPSGRLVLVWSISVNLNRGESLKWNGGWVNRNIQAAGFLDLPASRLVGEETVYPQERPADMPAQFRKFLFSFLDSAALDEDIRRHFPMLFMSRKRREQLRYYALPGMEKCSRRNYLIFLGWAVVVGIVAGGMVGAAIVYLNNL
jgi:hypothetical protein